MSTEGIMSGNAEKKAIISYNRMDENSVHIAQEICRELSASGIEPLSLKYDDGADGRLIGVRSADSGVGCVCMITVGGDGSIISHGKLAAVWGIPLLGVNTGRLGFMANLEPLVTTIQCMVEIALILYSLPKSWRPTV